MLQNIMTTDDDDDDDVYLVVTMMMTIFGPLMVLCLFLSLFWGVFMSFWSWLSLSSSVFVLHATVPEGDSRLTYQLAMMMTRQKDKKAGRQKDKSKALKGGYR